MLCLPPSAILKTFWSCFAVWLISEPKQKPALSLVALSSVAWPLGSVLKFRDIPDCQLSISKSNARMHILFLSTRIPSVRLGYVTETNWPRGTEKTPHRDWAIAYRPFFRKHDGRKSQGRRSIGRHLPPPQRLCLDQWSLKRKQKFKNWVENMRRWVWNLTRWLAERGEWVSNAKLASQSNVEYWFRRQN